jgi:hypothetical protein
MDNNDTYEKNQGMNESESEGSSSSSGGSSFKDSSPEDVKNRVKETVQKGVAAVAGALKGFSEEAKKNDLAGSTKQAIQKAGETTREVAGTVRDEYKGTKEHLTSATGTGKGTGSGSSVGSSSMGSSSSGSSMSNVGSTGGSSSSLKDLPDISKTEIGKKDDELIE